MSDLAGYKLWLTNLQRQPVFMDNYWSALLANDMKDGTNSFQIPYFVVEEELKKEDGNVHLVNKQDVIISNALRLKMNNLYYSLQPEMKVKMAALGPVLVTRNAQRRKFEEELSKIAPVPVPRTRVVDQKKRTTVADALVKHSETSAIQAELNAVKDEESPKTVLQSPNQTGANPSNHKKRIGKCWQFPQCPFDNNRCPYTHPKLRCTKFPNCPRGWECLFLHDFCENDGYCEEPNCAYEHLVSKTTYYRQQRAPEENARPIAAVAPIVHKEVAQENKGAEPATKSTAPSSTHKKKRCQYFPQCKKSDADCPFFHPFQMCRNLPAGRKCPGQWCLYKHGACANDGSCTDLKCVYEHFKSLPVFLRRREQKQNEGSLSRATSISNISTCSEVRVTGRRKSVTFEDELDTNELRKDSTDQKPVGILRSPKARQRCKFGARCRTKNCEYEHVLEQCKAFPNCPNGGVCIFVHDVCENDGVCSKENCDYKHNLPHEIGNKWCTYGSRCTRVGCKFIHPKECNGPCPTPGNCWMYHRPAPRQGCGPGFPPGPGFGPMPPPSFMPPAGIRYGFGPNFTYRQPPPPPGPGYGMDPRMGPVFPPPGHFPPSGYDPRYLPGNGGTGQGRGYAPPHPPRPTTPGFSPQQSPQSETSKRERQNSKNRYQQWLCSIQRHISHSFLNNYWCAKLAQDMEETKQSKMFKIPYFIVEEELKKEDDNVNRENTEDGYVSAALRHWLVHLLKPYNDKVNVLNLDSVLRSFIHNQITLPSGVTFPLGKSTYFHNLPTECKLWIIYMVKNHKKQSCTLQRVAMDSMGNDYFIVPDCRLYVKVLTVKATLPIDEAKLKGQHWESLYRYVHTQQWILLSDNQEGWKVVTRAFDMFKLNDVHNSLHPGIFVKLTSQSLSNIVQDKTRREFTSHLNKLEPIPSIELWEKKVNTCNQTVKKKTSDNDVNALKNALEAINVKEFSHPISPTAINANKNSNEVLGKCWNFPQCPLHNSCKYIHPKLPCTKFPIQKCKLGWRCYFLHEPCPNDANCEEPNCAYEHWKSIPTYYRIPRGEEQNNKPRPVASVTPLVRKVSDQDSRAQQACGQSTGSSQEPKRRCGYFPRCDRIHTNDEFFHPMEKCKKLAAGQKCDGQWCLFLHGDCPSDGTCTDMSCIFEHHHSPTVVERRVLANKKKQGSLSRNPSTTNLSRINSMSNISLCSNRTGGRRKSVSFDFDSEDQCDVEKKSSTTAPSPGILRPMGTNRKGRCRFGEQCTNKECDYMHPREKCPVFPKCPLGGACRYKHEICKSDGVCMNENCDFEHTLRRPTKKYWCNDGSQCKRVNCKFIHPKSPGPGAKPVVPPRITAPPSSPQQPARGSASGTPSSPDYAGAPLHWQTADPRYGNGANFNYGYHGANGYGPGPGMGPGGYGHSGFQPGPGAYAPYPWYSQGYDYGYGPGMGYGGYGNMPGYVPPPIPHPQQTPPPSYNEDEQRFLDSKNRP
ncbi:hypothetical protein PRIPAC_73168 [Pristionchus pacificus]|uniref:Zinc finger CCCH domain-containing protein 14 n=1 Tax=Pristionchus pacificus TaxID=54126 RepID=A0A2A6C1V7_PRIPA|nr:hypothetical protein PRIPAC_73168 [Pristionchus pacificus]|eukprot:PDM72003.1 hypothetical protein PRIPAC_38410 [Pristionchus pacificus]